MVSQETCWQPKFGEAIKHILFQLRTNEGHFRNLLQVLHLRLPRSRWTKLLCSNTIKKWKTRRTILYLTKRIQTCKAILKMMKHGKICYELSPSGRMSDTDLRAIWHGFSFSFSSLDEIRTCSMSYDLVRLLSVIVRGGENEEMHTNT